MEYNLSWNTDLKSAISEAKGNNKLVLVFFNIPTCWECNALGEDGFGDERVQQYVDNNYVPVMFLTKQNEEARAKFNVNWSPTLIVLDENGVEHYRSAGAQNGTDLLATLIVARGKAEFNKEKYDSGIKYFDQVINGLPESTSFLEAYYWKGACYDKKGDLEAVKKIFNMLSDKYPNSHWGKAASSIRRIQ